MTTDRDALVHAVGQAIIADAAVADGRFDGFALVVTYDADSRRLAGFRYVDDEPAHATTPASPELDAALDALREATRVDGGAPWNACVVRIKRPSNRITVEFAYGDDAANWVVTPETLAAVTGRARPG